MYVLHTSSLSRSSLSGEQTARCSPPGPCHWQSEAGLNEAHPRRVLWAAAAGEPRCSTPTLPRLTPSAPEMGAEATVRKTVVASGEFSGELLSEFFRARGRVQADNLKVSQRRAELTWMGRGEGIPHWITRRPDQWASSCFSYKNLLRCHRESNIRLFTY